MIIQKKNLFIILINVIDILLKELMINKLKKLLKILKLKFKNLLKKFKINRKLNKKN
jgi:hypothetical protein